VASVLARPLGAPALSHVLAKPLGPRALLVIFSTVGRRAVQLSRHGLAVSAFVF
jgi:hypothetical protein